MGTFDSSWGRFDFRWGRFDFRCVYFGVVLTWGHFDMLPYNHCYYRIVSLEMESCCFSVL